MEAYNEILERMIGSYESYAGFRPHEESDIMIRLRVLAGEIYSREAEADFMLRQMFPSTAAGEYLDRHAAERGLERKVAQKASGTVTFYPEEETHGDIMIPAGTQVCTYSDMMRFSTDSDALLRAADGSASVSVTALRGGAAYNVREGSVSIIVTPVAGIGAVENTAAFEGGADEESDEELRKRIIESYTDVVNGANAAYYKRLAMSVPGVYSASVVGRSRGNGTVDVYISGVGEPVPSAVRSRVQALLNEGRALNADVQAHTPSAVQVPLYIRLSVEAGYDFSAVSATVRQAVSGYINALGIGKDFHLSDAGRVIDTIKGVSAFRFSESYGSDRTIPNNSYASAGTIQIVEV